jgi:hypothetical protein
VAQAQPFDLGQAMARGFRIISSNFLVFSAVILVISIALFVIQVVGMLTFGVAAGLASQGEPQFSGGMIVFFLVFFAVALVSMGFSQALMAHGAACDLEGRKATFSSAWSVALKHCVPVAIIMLLTGILVFIASIFFLIPGIILGVFIGMAACARVIDNLGVFESFSASANISEGNRWVLFAYYLVTYILLYVCIGIVWFLFMAMFVGGMQGSMSADGTPQLGAGTIIGGILYFLFLLVATVILPQVTGVIPAAAYAQFKAAIGDRRVASAFD